MRAPRANKADQTYTGAFAKSGRELKVMLVYEDLGMGVQGKEIFDLIAKEAGGENAARLTVWRFDFFHSAELTRAVSRQAAEADVIIIAPRNPDILPPQVKAWLEQWPPRRKSGTGALIALFDPNVVGHAKSSDVALLLWRAAGRAEMDFFYRKPGMIGRTSNAAKIRAGAISLFAATNPVCAIKQNWGLNE